MLTVDYYSDVLCVWAWIAQRRIDELNKKFGEQISLKYHYVDIFGDTETKMATQWDNRDGFNGFAEHVRHAAEQFEEAPTNPDIWKKVRPTTSANAHLYLKAVQLVHDEKQSIAMALAIRKAFFINAEDISDMAILHALVKAQALDVEKIQRVIDSGAAMALLMSDYQLAKAQNIKGSPSYVMDNGRQTLYGNVGYRVLHANIEELLKHPADEASWC